MDRLRSRAAALLAGLALAGLFGAGFVLQARVTVGAFDDLEADQSIYHAERLRIALDYETRLLEGYGSTNSLWDDSHLDVARGDRDAFAEDFPPGDTHDVYLMDGILGIGPDGGLRVGGLVDEDLRYEPPPPDLAAPEVLRALYDPRAEPGTPRCGVVVSSRSPFLFCGFGAFVSDGTGRPSGGLVFLKALAGHRLAPLGEDVGLELSMVPGARARTVATMRSRVGDVRVGVRTLGSDRMALELVADSVTGRPVVLQAVHARPIHRTAGTVAGWMIVAFAGMALLLLLAVVAMIRVGIRRQVGPLRRTAEAVVTSGDRTLRVGARGRGEIPALGRAIDAMLDGLAGQDERIRAEREARERQMRSAFLAQQLSRRYVRDRAQELIDESTGGLVTDLRRVLAGSSAVLAEVGTIDERVSLTESVTRTVVEQAREADRVLAALGESLDRVGGIAELIAGVAGQTNLLSVNATIEAVRAGEAGRGFGVVAHEVKNLATETARSTDEISRTVESLQRDAAAMAASITRVIEGIDSIDRATAQVGAAAGDQRQAVESLGAGVEESIARIEAMAGLTEGLERRRHERVTAEGPVELDGGGRPCHGELCDLGGGGLRAALPAGDLLAEGAEVTARFTVSGRELRVPARVVWRGDGRDGRIEAGLEFVETPPAVREAIAAHVASMLDGDQP